MDMIYTWCEEHGVKWFYNQDNDFWVFERPKGRSFMIMDCFIKDDPRMCVKWLEEELF